MRNRLLLSLFGASGVVVALMAAISGGSSGARIAVGAVTPAPTAPQPYTLTKTADSEEVIAGSPIGFTIELTVLDTNGTVWFIEDTLPPGPGVNWTVDTFSGAASCIVYQGPQRLECVGNGGTGQTHIVVHVVSQTTVDSPGDYANEALAGYPGFEDISAHDSVTVLSPTPTPSPSPSPSPSPTPINLANELFGGHDDQGNNLIIIWDHAQNSLTIDGFDLPLGAACPGQTDTFNWTNIPITGDGSFQKQDGTHGTQGEIIQENGPPVAQGNITVGDGTNCSNTLAFVAEQPDRAILIGDDDCSFWNQVASAAGGVAFPQGASPTPAPAPAPDPKKGITIKDVIETLKWVAGLAEDSPPLDCPLLDAAFPTPVPGSSTPTVTPTSTPPPTYMQGDVDCDGHVDAKDALEILQFLANEPPKSHGSGCRKVGHFLLLDR